MWTAVLLGLEYQLAGRRHVAPSASQHWDTLTSAPNLTVRLTNNPGDSQTYQRLSGRRLLHAKSCLLLFRGYYG